MWWSSVSETPLADRSSRTLLHLFRSNRDGGEFGLCSGLAPCRKGEVGEHRCWRLGDNLQLRSVKEATATNA